MSLNEIIPHYLSFQTKFNQLYMELATPKSESNSYQLLLSISVPRTSGSQSGGSAPPPEAPPSAPIGRNFVTRLPRNRSFATHASLPIFHRPASIYTPRTKTKKKKIKFTSDSILSIQFHYVKHARKRPPSCIYFTSPRSPVLATSPSPCTCTEADRGLSFISLHL